MFWALSISLEDRRWPIWLAPTGRFEKGWMPSYPYSPDFRAAGSSSLCLRYLVAARLLLGYTDSWHGIGIVGLEPCLTNCRK